MISLFIAIGINMALSIITCLIEKPVYAINMVMGTDSFIKFLLGTLWAIIMTVFYLLFVLNCTFWKVVIEKFRFKYM